MAQSKLELANRVSGQTDAANEGDEEQMETEIKGRITSSLLAQVRERSAA